MDDLEILQVLINEIIVRYGRSVQNYELEIANLNAQLIRFRQDAESTKNTFSLMDEQLQNTTQRLNDALEEIADLTKPVTTKVEILDKPKVTRSTKTN